MYYIRVVFVVAQEERRRSVTIVTGPSACHDKQSMSEVGEGDEKGDWNADRKRESTEM